MNNPSVSGGGVYDPNRDGLPFWRLSRLDFCTMHCQIN